MSNANPSIRRIENPILEVSPDAVELFILLTAVVELINHDDYDREMILQKIAGCSRGMANTCYQDLLRVRDSYKTIETGK